MKPGLERIVELLRRLGDLTCGSSRSTSRDRTEGVDGRVSAAALRFAGLRVGLFTSPHLQRYNERIRINEEPISDEALSALVERIRPLAAGIAAVHGAPTEFEVGTALAFAHFAEQAVDVAVVETGLGGRLDATNVLDPLLAVITPITLDHTETLGSTLSAVAGEKAGIIKVAVSRHGTQSPEKEVLLTVAQREGPSPYWSGRTDSPCSASHAGSSRRVERRGRHGTGYLRGRASSYLSGPHARRPSAGKCSRGCGSGPGACSRLSPADRRSGGRGLEQHDRAGPPRGGKDRSDGVARRSAQPFGRRTAGGSAASALCRQACHPRMWNL